MPYIPQTRSYIPSCILFATAQVQAWLQPVVPLAGCTGVPCGSTGFPASTATHFLDSVKWYFSHELPIFGEKTEVVFQISKYGPNGCAGYGSSQSGELHLPGRAAAARPKRHPKKGLVLVPSPNLLSPKICKQKCLWFFNDMVPC